MYYSHAVAFVAPHTAKYRPYHALGIFFFFVSLALWLSILHTTAMRVTFFLTSSCHKFIVWFLGARCFLRQEELHNWQRGHEDAIMGDDTENAWRNNILIMAMPAIRFLNNQFRRHATIYFWRQISPIPFNLPDCHFHFICLVTLCHCWRRSIHVLHYSFLQRHIPTHFAML